MKAIIKWTLWQRRWSVFWWSIGLVAFVSLELSVYPSIHSQADELNEVMRNLPPALKSLFGASVDLFSPIGYLSSRLYYLLLPLMLSVLAIGLGSSLIAREESDNTLELILSRPISRGKLLVAKLASAAVIILTVSTVALLSVMIWVKAVDLSVAIPQIAFVALMTTLLACLFGSFAFFCAAMGRFGRGASIGLASLLGLGSYVIASLETNVSWLSWPSKLLPYHYYNPTAVLSGWYCWRVAAVFTLIIAVFIVGSYIVFRQRDLNG